MLFRRLEARGGRVVATQTGSAGDSGTGSMAHMLTLEGRSRRRLLDDQAVHERARETRQVVRAVPRTAIGDGAACMAMGLGLDARGVLPPFPPVGRNAEAVFATVLRRCRHDALLGFLPWTVDHHPPQARAELPEALFASFAAFGANDLLRLLVVASSVEPDRADPARSHRALGDVLVRWSSLALADFEEVVRVQALRSRSLEAVLLEDALRRHGRAPPFWARDVDRALSVVREALPRAALGYPVDLVAALGEPTARAHFRELVRRYGELLRVWPDLWTAALELRSEGLRAATRV
jgi:hypothetical protein